MFDASERKFKMAINGVLSASPSDFTDGTFACSDPDFPFQVGGVAGQSGLTFSGQIDEVRVSSVVRYSSNFAPPATLASDASTRGLWRFDESPGSTTFADASGNGQALTGLGGAAICGVPPPAPANDNFASRAVIAGASAMVSGSNVGATKEAGEPNHAGNSGGKSVWWSWTAPENGPVTVTTDGSDFDTLLGVYTGASVSSLDTIASDDDGGPGTTSLTTFSGVAGTAYQIAVDGFGGASGSITLRISQSNVCNVTISPIGWSVSSSGGSVTVTVAASGNSCAGTASHPCGDWLTASPSSGTGGGSLTVSASANVSCSPRSCTLTIGGQTFTVDQAAGSGSFAITPSSRLHGPGSETGTVTVSASSGDCSWTATPNCGWVRITSSASGTGDGTVGYAVEANPSCSPKGGRESLLAALAAGCP